MLPWFDRNFFAARPTLNFEIPLRPSTAKRSCFATTKNKKPPSHRQRRLMENSYDALLGARVLGSVRLRTGGSVLVNDAGLGRLVHS